MQGWFERILSSRFSRNVAVLTGGEALGQALVVLATPVLTRLYSPEDFGVLAVFVAVLSMIVVVASLRYELAIPLARDNEVAVNLLILSLTVVLVTSTFTGIGVWLLADQFVWWTGTPALRPYLWLLPLSLAGAGGYQVLTYWAIRKSAFGLIARTKLSKGVAQVLTQVVLGVMGVGAGGLLFGDMAGRAGGSGTLVALALRRDREAFKRVSAEGIWWASGEYRRFPLLSSSSSLLNSAGLQVPALLLAAFYGPQVAGWFVLGQRVVSMPLTLVGRAVAQVYIGEASRLIRERPAALHGLFVRTGWGLLLLGSVPIIPLVVGAPWLFRVIFGDDWQVAGLYVQILGPMLLVQFVSFPLSQTLNLIARQDLQFVWDAGRLVLVVGGLALAHLLNFPAWQTVVVYSGAMLIAYAVLLLFAKTNLSHVEQEGQRNDGNTLRSSLDTRDDSRDDQG